MSDPLPDQAKRALVAKYGSMWQAAAAFQPFKTPLSGARLQAELNATPVDPILADFVFAQVGIDLTGKS